MIRAKDNNNNYYYYTNHNYYYLLIENNIYILYFNDTRRYTCVKKNQVSTYIIIIHTRIAGKERGIV